MYTDWIQGNVKGVSRSVRDQTQLLRGRLPIFLPFIYLAVATLPSLTLLHPPGPFPYSQSAEKTLPLRTLIPNLSRLKSHPTVQPDLLLRSSSVCDPAEGAWSVLPLGSYRLHSSLESLPWFQHSCAELAGPPEWGSPKRLLKSTDSWHLLPEFPIEQVQWSWTLLFHQLPECGVTGSMGEPRPKVEGSVVFCCLLCTYLTEPASPRGHVTFLLTFHSAVRYQYRTCHSGSLFNKCFRPTEQSMVWRGAYR